MIAPIIEPLDEKAFVDWIAELTDGTSCIVNVNNSNVANISLWVFLTSFSPIQRSFPFVYRKRDYGRVLEINEGYPNSILGGLDVCFVRFYHCFTMNTQITGQIIG